MCRGIIPAYAGLTTRRSPESCTQSDHPRLRGVNEHIDDERLADAGSSPLTRG